jgi:quinol-cytochrome oxidoreductase complex cytochrome b subunit
MTEQNRTGLQQLGDAIRDLPKTLLWSILRHGTKDSRRTRAQIIFTNVFLHVHSIRTHRYSLKWSYSLGLGVMTLASLFLLSVTGLLLMVYYKPSVALAYHSVKDIIYVVPAGLMVRNVHRWSAHLMVVCCFLHMSRVFYTGSYKEGREYNWNVGIALLVLTLALSFTGYLLPWDQLAYWAVTIGANIAASPSELTDSLGMTEYLDLGAISRRLLLGADIIGDDALVRFYFLHCIVLPFALYGLLAVHLWRVRKDGGLSRPTDINESELIGIPKDEWAESTFGPKTTRVSTVLGFIRGNSPKVGKGPEQTVPSWPYAFRYEVAASLVIIALACVLAVLGDAPLKEMANPSVPENPAKAPWYFLGLQELVSYSAFMGGVGIPIIALIGLGLVPMLDRKPGRIGRWFEDEVGKRAALSTLLYSLVVCVGTLAFSVKFGWLRTWFPDIPQIYITFINPGTLIATAFALQSLWVIKKTNSVRAGAIALYTSFLVGFIVLTYFGTVHRGPNWDFYWWPSMWPKH